MSETIANWQLRLSKEAYERGDHIPAKWNVTFDDGADGCMPCGWYLTGEQRNGMPCDGHSYGPFEDENEAKAYIEVVLLHAMNFVV